MIYGFNRGRDRDCAGFLSQRGSLNHGGRAADHARGVTARTAWVEAGDVLLAVDDVPVAEALALL